MHQKDDYLSVDNNEAVHSCTAMKTYQLASIGRVVVIVEKPAMCSEYRVTIKHIEEPDKAVQFTPSRLDILFTFLCHYIFSCLIELHYLFHVLTISFTVGVVGGPPLDNSWKKST